MKSYYVKIKNIIIYSVLSILFLFLTFFILFHFGFFANFSQTKFNKQKLNYTHANVSVYDNENNILLNNTKQVKNIKSEEISKNLKNAFISIEDKSFFKHNGINYKRIIAAGLKNLLSFKIKEGASTISQQLIKNTHLTNEKTFKRKINEILLTQQLEKELSKEEILTAYLNAIYFGSGAFGINQASQRFFSKDIKDLSLSECATLAGIIKSPNTYSPISNPEKSKKRRNVVLKEMLKDKKISEKEYNLAVNEDLILNINKNFLGNNTYYNATIDEVCNILKITEKDLLLKNYQIYTYKNNVLQDKIEKEISEAEKYTNNLNCDCCALSIDNKTGGINAFFGKSDYDLISLKRQPGSAFKPIISYAPAIEYNLISPSTLILDEKININGYSPNNYKNKYYGWISTRNCLAKSLNIPSIKILNYVGIDKAKKFANQMGISFDKNDNGYSIALGGLTKGITIKELANCYQTFANVGRYIPAGFVKEIRTETGKIIYKHNTFGKQVIKESTSFLVTNMLEECVKNGTCRKLNIPNYNIAAKTGTVGIKNGNNTDAWNVSYTDENTLCIWFGSNNYIKTLPNNLTGANCPTMLAQSIYKSKIIKSKPFNKPNSIVELDINAIDYEENKKILLCDNNTPDRFKIKEYFSIENTPNEKSTLFNKIDNFNINAEIIKNVIEISFKANKYLKYEIIKECEDNKEIIAKVQDKNDFVKIIDEKVTPGNIYSYYVVAHYNNFLNTSNLNNIKKSNIVKIFLAQK